MPKVIGIDPGTVSLSLCGLDEGRVVLDRSLPSSEALASPSLVVDLLRSAGPIDLIAGPSGYGLPLISATRLSETDLRLAYLAPAGEPGGIRGLGALMRALAEASLPVLLMPGVIHLTSVPQHRKVNRVDMGTADKVCAAALALSELTARRGCRPLEVSFILLEVGSAFSAAVAVERGQIVDGVGGSSGPMGARAAGALDGEVAFLAGHVTKEMLFQGGASTIAGMAHASIDDLAAATTARAQLAWRAFVEAAIKAVASLAVSVAGLTDVVMSGRGAAVQRLRDELTDRLKTVLPSVSVVASDGFASEASHAAQGAALIADGLAGGRSAPLVEALGIRDASGTVLDHLYVITASAARKRIGIA